MDTRNLSTPLARYLAEHRTSDNSFPEADRNSDFFDRFTRIDEWLNENIHKHVNQGATANTETGQHSPVWLTDHGPDHIHTVMQRAGALSGGDPGVLSPYEAYLLLLAIHFHDVGNLFGRDEHERRVTEVMSQVDASLLGNSSFEKRMIRDIAMVHGGHFEGDRDTIGQLKYERHQKKHEPRVHLLAAILRVADELAEDCTRTSRFLVNNQLISPASEIYHIYADRLQRVGIFPEEHAVSLFFELDAGTGSKTFLKGDTQSYLFDEIKLRLLKMHKELVYCGRFLRPYVFIDTINVKVDICSANYFDVLHSMAFSIRENGYPTTPDELTSVCPEIAKETGASLLQRIAQIVEAAHAN